MTRRFIALGLLVAVAQLAAGCCWHRCCGWRWQHWHGGCGPVCSPSYSMPAGSSPIHSAPLFHGAPGCNGCSASAGYPAPGYEGGVAVAPPPVGPIISPPIPLQGGPSVEPPQGLPMPMQVKPNGG